MPPVALLKKDYTTDFFVGFFMKFSIQRILRIQVNSCLWYTTTLKIKTNSRQRLTLSRT